MVPPAFMTYQSREYYPDVTVDEPGPVRSRNGIAMNTCSLDFWPIPLGGGIVNGHQNPVLLLVNTVNHNFKQYCSDGFSFSPYRADKVVESFILPDNTGGSELAGNGLSAFGKEYTDHDQMQTPSRASMKYISQCGSRSLPAVRKNPFSKHWLSFQNVSFAKKNIGRMSHFLLSNCFQRAKVNLIFLESALYTTICF